MKKVFIYLLLVPILALCSCTKDKEQLATVRTNDAKVTYNEDQLVKQAEAVIGGIVINDGGVSISERGIVFGKTPNPSAKTILGNGVGIFSTTVQVNADTAYYYRAYAVTSLGTVYGDLKIIGIRPEKMVFPENFDGDDFPPPGWTIIDHDGDGHTWVKSDSQRLPVGAMSESDVGGMHPYNLLITPKFEVSGSDMIFSWEAGSIASGAVAEKYKVVVSTTGNTFDDFDEARPTAKKVFEETMTSEHSRNYVYREVDLSEFAGQQIYVAIVHYDCTDQWAMVIKNVNFSGANAGSAVTPPQISGYYRSGSPKDKEVEATAKGLVLAGGGTDNDMAMKWFLKQANGGDVVVIRASGFDGYNPYFYSKLGVQVNSVTTMVLDSREKANMSEVADIIKSAETLFIAGGDQWDYVNYWSGTKTADAIDYLVNTKKVVVGGTSAGMAVLGQFVFTAENGTPASSDALGNPYMAKVTLAKDVFSTLAIMNATITDSHYSNRTRHGRHVAFMALMANDWGLTAKGIGCDENTAICIDAANVATVYGPCAYFIRQNGAGPEVCSAGQPLTWNIGGNALKVYKLPGNDSGTSTFNLNDWTTASGGTWQWWSVSSGVLTETNL